MNDTRAPLVLYIPGLKPKPEPGQHRETLRRCLRAGLAKVDPEVAGWLGADAAAFDIVSWTYDFYGEHRDASLDTAAISSLLAKPSADADDRRGAHSWRRRLLRWVYHVGDRLPFLIPSLADENVALHLRDLRRYVSNENDIADTVRRHLKVPLRAAAATQRPVLLIAHSMGSVIAWDALWQLSRRAGKPVPVSLLLTLGSPLGQRYIQRRLLGSKETGEQRYPTSIRRWINIAAVGELTAIDRVLATDFSGMQACGLVESIEDFETYNWYRDHGVLNVHAEYGYLANADVAVHIAAWWRAQRDARGG